MARVLIFLAAVALSCAAPLLLARAEQRPVQTTIADLIAQPWKYHGKVVQVSGVLRYVLNGRGSRMNLGPDRLQESLIDVDGEDVGAIWLPRYRYNWANVELIAMFDGECVIPRGDGMLTVCADGGEHGYLIPKSVKVLGYVEPVIETKRTVELVEIDTTTSSAAGIPSFVRAIVDAVEARDVDALMRLDEPRTRPPTPEELARYRAATADLFLSGDLRIFNTRSPEPGRDYRLYHETGYTYTDDDYLCFCKQASCEGRWPRAGEIFNANPTRPWVCYRVERQNGRWYFE